MTNQRQFHPFRVELRLRVPALIARCIKKRGKKGTRDSRGPNRHKTAKNSVRNVRNHSNGQKYLPTVFTSGSYGKKYLHSNNDYYQPDKETYCGSYPPQTNKKFEQFSTQRSCLKRKLRLFHSHFKSEKQPSEFTNFFFPSPLTVHHECHHRNVE